SAPVLRPLVHHPLIVVACLARLGMRYPVDPFLETQDVLRQRLHVFAQRHSLTEFSLLLLLPSQEGLTVHATHIHFKELAFGEGRALFGHDHDPAGYPLLLEVLTHALFNLLGLVPSLAILLDQVRVEVVKARRLSRRNAHLLLKARRIWPGFGIAFPRLIIIP